MLQCIESLESRRLLSASATTIVGDELKLVSDAKSVKADLTQCGRTLAADARTINNDLRHLPASQQNHKLIATLKADVAHEVSLLKADASALVKAGSADARKAMADGLRVFLQPSNAKARAALATDLTKLQSETAAPLAKLLADLPAVQKVITADLNALAAANPTATQLKSDVTKAEADGNNCVTVANEDVRTVQSDVAALVHDLQT